MSAISWDDIPSIENAVVEWDFEPESSLDKRSCLRIACKTLRLYFDERNIQVNIASCKMHETGDLLNLSQSGLAILLDDTDLKEGAQTKVNLQLGGKKVISKAVVRNICSFVGRERIGFEFINPSEENSAYIKRLVNSRAYCL